MAKIIDFKKTAPVGKHVLEEIIRTLKSLDADKVSSVLVAIGLEHEGGRGTFLLVRGLDFYDIGYLESQLSVLKLELLDSHTTTDVETADEFLENFSKDEPESDD